MNTEYTHAAEIERLKGNIEKSVSFAALFPMDDASNTGVRSEQKRNKSGENVYTIWIIQDTMVHSKQ